LLFFSVAQELARLLFFGVDEEEPLSHFANLVFHAKEITKIINMKVRYLCEAKKRRAGPCFLRSGKKIELSALAECCPFSLGQQRRLVFDDIPLVWNISCDSQRRTRC
jgi:hypothetical protein